MSDFLVTFLANHWQLLTTILVVVVLAAWLTFRYIPNDRIGIVEKLWSARGSLTEGAVIALHGEAGYQADILRGGMHFGLWRWQYAVHKFPLVTIKQGKIGYVFSRGGDQLQPSQTLAKIVECNNFQDARKFLGRRRAKKAASGASSAKASTRSTSPCSTSSPRTASSPWNRPRAWRSGKTNSSRSTASAR